MAIKKALILFAGLVAIMLSFAVAELFLLEQFDLSEDTYRHMLGMITLITPVMAYGTMFWFSEFQVNWNSVPRKFRSLQPVTLYYVLFIAVGLEFLDRPLFDLPRIWNLILNGNAEPYILPEADKFILYSGFFAIVMAPIFEELFFRKLLFGKLLSKYSVTTAVLVSSFCFALLHFSFRNLLPTFIFGVIACLLYNKTGNILYTIILHAAVNVLWFTLQYWGEDFYSWIFELKYNYVYWLMFAFGLGLTYFSVSQIVKLKTSRSKE